MPPKNRKVAVMGYRSVGKSLAPFAVLSSGHFASGSHFVFLGPFSSVFGVFFLLS